jgi:IPT/TIG domain-containing protein/WD40 repeat protein
MKRLCAATVVGLAAILALEGCSDYGNTFQGNTGALITSLSPSNIPAGGSDLTITVNGARFVAKTVVEWNNQKLKTTVTTDSTGNVTLVTAVVPASLIAAPGKASVFTQNPFSGSGNNGLSNTIIFLINNPPNKIPQIASVTAGTAGPAGLPITITGTDFLSSSSDPTQVSTVNFTLGGTQTNITPAASAITATQIQTVIPSALLALNGCGTITVFNPASPPVPNLPGSVGSGGGTSNAIPFAVGSGVCPASVKASSSATTSEGVTEETPAVSVDGHYVAFSAVEKDRAQVFLRDTCVGATAVCQPRTQLVSVAADGSAADDDSRSPSMSADGRYIAFSSAASNLAANVPTGRQIYLRDTCIGADSSCKPSTTLVSADAEGALVGSEAILPSVSASGRFVAFLAVKQSQDPARASSKASAANSGYRQVFVRDTCLGAANCTPKTIRISLVPGDGNGGKLAGPAISGNSKQLALPGAVAATLFTHSVAIDDQVFLAATKPQ